MRLYHNIQSLQVYSRYANNLTVQSSALNKISSGLKVQTAKDDPNKKAQSETLKMQIRGLQMSTRNIQNSISMLQTADGGMDNIQDSLIRLRELTVQAGGTTDPVDRQAIQDEMDSLTEHIDYIANNTEVNGVKLLGKISEGDLTKLKTLSGYTADDQIDIPKADLTAEGLGIGTVVDGEVKDAGKLSADDYHSTIQRVDNAIEKVNRYRGKLGGISNRLDSAYANYSDMAGRVEGIEAELTGSDISEDMIDYTKDSVILQASMAMMKQTNDMPQQVLQILQNVK